MRIRCVNTPLYLVWKYGCGVSNVFRVCNFCTVISVPARGGGGVVHYRRRDLEQDTRPHEADPGLYCDTRLGDSGRLVARDVNLVGEGNTTQTDWF
jgi:hypothetical protein